MGQMPQPHVSPLIALKQTADFHGGIKAYEQAKADGLTKLEFEPWVVSRTPEFKNWFGDWESARALEFLERRSSTVILQGDELNISLSFRALVEEVFQTYEKCGCLEIPVQGIGLVALDRRAIQNSRGHGDRPERLVAFLAVPEILQNGLLIDSRPMRTDPLGRFSHIAGRLQLSDKQYIAVVQVKTPTETNSRMFTHQVFLKKKLQHPLHIRAASAEHAAEQTSGQRGAGVAEHILRKIYSVNPKSISKEIEAATQEPLPEAIEAFLALMRAKGVTLSPLVSQSPNYPLSPDSQKLLRLAKHARRVIRSSASEEVKAQAMGELEAGMKDVTGPGLTVVPLKRLLVAFALRRCSEGNLINAALDHDRATARRLELFQGHSQANGHSLTYSL